MTRIGMALIALTAWSSTAQAQDSAISFGLRFDPATATALAARGEMVIVSSWYYGEAARPDVPVDEMGQVFLMGEELTVFPRDQMITLGANLANARLADVKAPMVNINIFTARHTDENNLIDCDFVEGPVAEIESQDLVLTCTLLDF